MKTDSYHTMYFSVLTSTVLVLIKLCILQVYMKLNVCQDMILCDISNKAFVEQKALLFPFL